MFILDSVFNYIKHNVCGVCINLLLIDYLHGRVRGLCNHRERDLLNILVHEVLFIIVCDVTHYLHIKPLKYNYVYVCI